MVDCLRRKNAIIYIFQKVNKLKFTHDYETITWRLWFSDIHSSHEYSWALVNLLELKYFELVHHITFDSDAEYWKLISGFGNNYQNVLKLINY